MPALTEGIPADPTQVWPTPAEVAEARSAAKAAKPVAAPPTKAQAADKARYGESVVRELLGASFIEEEQVAPRVVPRPADD